MIKNKLGICVDCPDDELKPIIKDRCQYHYWQNLRSKSQKKQAQKKKQLRLNQEQWFEDRRKEMTGICANCGGKTEKDTERWKWSIAHILPKRATMFPSVATHPLNSIELCSRNFCHDMFDKDWETASKMHCFPLALYKFRLFQSEIAPEERSRIPDVFLK